MLNLNPYKFWFKAGGIVALLAAVWGWAVSTRLMAASFVELGQW